MINKLIILADKLDSIGFLKEAEDLDVFINKLSEDSMDDFPEELTRIEHNNMKTTPPLDMEVMEKELIMSDIEIISKLKAIFSSLPNPTEWDDRVKAKVNELIVRLQEVL